uniref:Ribosomal proteins 3 n=1 Tax=Podosphaera xanthii TaxID=135283 RepID=A0A6B9MSP1_9PEZI|nr:Ribosomal proteins 3 [Podosphaera xanthii]
MTKQEREKARLIFSHYLGKASRKDEIISKLDTNQTSNQKKYLPSFTKEWKSTIYSFDKRVLTSIPTLMENVNKIIRSYLDLFFKNYKFANMHKFVLLKRRRNFLRKIFSSRVEIRYINDKVIITLYVLNRERELLQKKFVKMNSLIKRSLIRRWFNLMYKNKLSKIHRTFNSLNNKYLFLPSMMRKNLYLKSKIENFNKFKIFKSFHMEKIWANLLHSYLNIYLTKLRKYNLLYSLNTFKFNKLNMLWVLTTILNKFNILKNKKIEYNIINLKYLTNNPDLFTNVLALRLKRQKMKGFREISKILKRAYMPNVINSAQERIYIKAMAKNKLKFNQFFSYLVNGKGLSKIIYKNKSSDNIYNSIKYKNIGGIKVEIKGRLTKRYRADRSIYLLRWKGGLKNIDSSFQKKSTTLLRGNVKPNTAYSITASKRRIGAFAVKGWIAGK